MTFPTHPTHPAGRRIPESAEVLLHRLEEERDAQALYVANREPAPEPSRLERFHEWHHGVSTSRAGQAVSCLTTAALIAVSAWALLVLAMICAHGGA